MPSKLRRSLLKTATLLPTNPGTAMWLYEREIEIRNKDQCLKIKPTFHSILVIRYRNQDMSFFFLRTANRTSFFQSALDFLMLL